MSPTDPPPPNFPPPPPSDPGPGVPATGGSADAGAAFTWAWKKFQENAATLIVAFLVILIATFSTFIVLSIIAGLIIYSTDPSGLLMPDSSASPGSVFLATLLITFPTVTVGYLLASGFVKALLSIADGQKPEIGQALTPHNPPKTIVYALIVAGISAILSAVGALVPIVGELLSNSASLVVGFLLSFGLFFLVDRGLEPVEAIKASVDLVTKNLGAAIIFYLCAIAASLLGFLACCIGIIVGAPVGMLIYTYGFRQLTGRGVAP
jgi:uncharacterized membrane protein